MLVHLWLYLPCALGVALLIGQLPMSNHDEQQEPVWPPPPDRPTSDPVEQVRRSSMTNVGWLDALLGVFLGLVAFIAALVGVALVAGEFFPPPHSEAGLLSVIVIAAGLSGFLFWLGGRWFRTLAVAAASATSILVIFLIVGVLLFSGMPD